MKIPIVKEWGSWAVFISSCLAALAAGLIARPWEARGDFIILTLLTILGLALLINSKHPLSSALRTKGGKKEHILWFLFFVLGGLAFLVPFLNDGIKEFRLFSLLVLSYAFLLSIGKEHHILAELNGFALLTLSAPVVYFAVTGGLSLRLYAAVAIFFAAGVIKVRVRIRRTLFFRWVMILYCIGAVIIYYLLRIPVVLLLPLTENVLTVLRMQEEKLKTTGYTELTKGVIFIILIAIFWS